MRARIAIGLGVHDEHGLTDLGGHRILAGQGAHSAVEHDVAGHELAHRLHRVRKSFNVRGVGLEFSLRVAWNIEVLLANVIDPIITERLACGILESCARQHHHSATHAGRYVPRNHRAATRDAVIDEYARARSLPAQYNLLPRIDQSQITTA